MKFNFLKNNIDFLYESANRYGRQDSDLIVVGIELVSGHEKPPTIIPIESMVMREGNILTFKPSVSLTVCDHTQEEDYKIKEIENLKTELDEKNTELKNLKNEVRDAKKLIVELRSVNKKIKKESTKNIGSK